MKILIIINTVIRTRKSSYHVIMNVADSNTNAYLIQDIPTNTKAIHKDIIHNTFKIGAIAYVSE